MHLMQSEQQQGFACPSQTLQSSSPETLPSFQSPPEPAELPPGHSEHQEPARLVLPSG